MPTQKKVETVQQMAELFSRSSYVVATEYRGMKVSDVTQFRKTLRPLGIEYHVVKNTLARLAAEQAGKAELKQLLEGPVGLVLGHGDIVQPAKVIAEFRRNTTNALVVKGALMDSRVLSAADVTRLTTLPSREVLVVRVLGMIQSPLYRLQSVLVANQRGLLTVLSERKKQLGGTPNVN